MTNFIYLPGTMAVYMNIPITWLISIYIYHDLEFYDKQISSHEWFGPYIAVLISAISHCAKLAMAAVDNRGCDIIFR